MFQPDWECVNSTKETFDDSELDHSTNVDWERVEREIIDPGRDGETWSKLGVETEES